MNQPQKKKLTEDLSAYHRAYRQKNREKLRQKYQANKEVLLARRKYKKKRIFHEPDMKGRLRLIEKVEAQRGWVDAVDCFKIIDCYTDIFGDSTPQIDAWTEEEQIIYMYDQIKNLIIHKENVCTKCGLTKAIEEFTAHAERFNGYTNTCKECNKEARLKREAEMCEKDDSAKLTKIEYMKKWREENKETMKQKAKVKYEANKELNKQKRKEQYKKKKEQYLQQKKDYYIKNRESILEKKKQYDKKRTKSHQNDLGDV